MITRLRVQLLRWSSTQAHRPTGAHTRPRHSPSCSQRVRHRAHHAGSAAGHSEGRRPCRSHARQRSTTTLRSLDSVRCTRVNQALDLHSHRVVSTKVIFLARHSNFDNRATVFNDFREMIPHRKHDNLKVPELDKALLLDQKGSPPRVEPGREGGSPMDS